MIFFVYVEKKTQTNSFDLDIRSYSSKNSYCLLAIW